jgi:RIO kinase 1
VAKNPKEIWKVEKNVFSMSSERNLFKLSSQGFFSELESPLSIGKEANIFTAKTKDGGRIIVKMYRLENCNFNRMLEYILPDPRYLSLRRGKRNIIFSWVQREYRNLMKAREVIRVPIPLAYKDNILLMEFIGDETPALRIKEDLPEGKKAIAAFFDATVDAMAKLYQAGLIHGDLSEYNILNFHDTPVFIDFSQGTTRENPNGQEILERDVRNVCTFFNKFIDVDEKRVLLKVVKK